MNARTEILARIRAGIAEAPAVQSIPRDYEHAAATGLGMSTGSPTRSTSTARGYIAYVTTTSKWPSAG